MATYAIGDVQGCYDELRELLDRVGFDSARDRLWFVGDLVNRGPKSLDVLRFVRELGKRAITVLGNHDLHLVTQHEGFERGRNDDTLDDVLAAPDARELVDWLRTRQMMHVEGSYAMVHAGLLPQWTIAKAWQLAREAEVALAGADYKEFLKNMYGSKPDEWSDSLNGWDRLRVIVNAMTRLRFCTPQGKMDFRAKGKTPPPGYVAWYELREEKDERLRFLQDRGEADSRDRGAGRCRHAGFHGHRASESRTRAGSAQIPRRQPVWAAGCAGGGGISNSRAGSARHSRRLCAARAVGLPGERQSRRADGASFPRAPGSAARERRHESNLAGEESAAREARGVRGEDSPDAALGRDAGHAAGSKQPHALTRSKGLVGFLDDGAQLAAVQADGDFEGILASHLLLDRISHHTARHSTQDRRNRRFPAVSDPAACNAAHDAARRPAEAGLAALDGHLAHRFHGGETHHLLSPGFMLVVDICRFMGGTTGERRRECSEEERRFHGLSFPR